MLDGTLWLEALAEPAALSAELLPEVQPASRLTESAAASSRENRRVYFMAKSSFAHSRLGPGMAGKGCFFHSSILFRPAVVNRRAENEF